MECNKDEALRAKDIAIRKFTDGDFSGAKKFALKAQTLYHGLEGITQMIATLEVYISTENKINGEIDMYGILGVTPNADDETIKKQYRKLLLQLHPDKNKFIGADGAFQRVSEAFNTLSDKAKRAAYNTRRNIRTGPPKVPSKSSNPTWPTGIFQGKFSSHGSSTSSFQKKVPTRSGNSTGRAGVNGFHKPPSSTASRGKASKKSEKSQKGSSPSSQTFVKNEDTFWTRCNRCLMQYEYMRVYLNQILKCPHCQEGFQAIEVPPPSNLSPGRPEHHRKTHSSSGPQKHGNFNVFTARSGPQYSTTTRNNTGPNDYNMDRERAKREYEAALAAAKRERNDDPGFVLSGDGPAKRAREMNDRAMNYCAFSNFSSKVNNTGRELSGMELRNMLSAKALVEIHQKLKEWKLARQSRISSKEKEKAKQKERQKSKFVKDVVMSHDDDDDDQEVDSTIAMNVPDPDFHVFDLDRSESCFGNSQVWAMYDNDDGMPRFYAIIHEVISTDPFKVSLSWLNPKDNAEFGLLSWEGQGLIKSCGDFVMGKYETNNSLNSFSHKVEWVKGNCGVIQVYPRKGDIWSLYRNWSKGWKSDTHEDIIHAYDVVEVLNDYNEERGVCVAPLVKETRFLSVFSKQPNPKEAKWIPREEMFRFSHQIPSHVLTGEESPNAPMGFIELDPASTPSELLHKTTLKV